MHTENERALESGIVTDLSGRMTYGAYLALDQLLTAQHPVSEPQHHDEMLFIIQHQTTELWLKQLLHELSSARELLARDDLREALKRIARIKRIQDVMTQQWSVLATLTPTEYAQFRGALGNSSGFQSVQYRAVEFALGNKNEKMLSVFRDHPANLALLTVEWEKPTLYDEFLRFAARRGLPIPTEILERDVREPYRETPELVPAIREIYQDPSRYWDLYEACEDLVDLEDNFQFWRFRHLKTVARTIGMKVGTGGSSGVGFLQRALDLTFFPELYTVRTEIGS
ncbi:MULTISPECIES: tryptophan 2,3-dioxygenase [unclassified Microbacterium]|uniref:tryptophan 2,3-dioxygenase n=1 Tax=unclassified Microbacterium TaxID=2609290 RepID=UPI00160555DE|nr:MULTISPECIES: tryptophan 2,3-dioxygenase family protein [unclassified Microbacterium]QNA93496.1 tryptophan 2,3-dioxygenase [Microbacterium sp. Se63.02b]QYM63741.1 tryptophan 2,3-dioxygenase [Microbacterium sp. Se5.02b]